jgi:hypothetical protein
MLLNTFLFKVDQINESKYISVICDGCTDTAAIEEEIVYVRTCNKFSFADCLPTDLRCCPEVSWEITDSRLKLEDPVTKTTFCLNRKKHIVCKLNKLCTLHC